MNNFTKLNWAVIALCLLTIASCKKKDDTQPNSDSVPSLNTIAAKEITDKSAKVGGTVSNTGGSAVTERGICWSTLPGPNINNDVIKSGAGDGSFEVTIEGLAKGTKYYIRAYAKNSAGVGYGNELEFTTSSLESIQVNGYTLYIHPSSSGNVTWGKDNETTGATSLDDGRANTNIISQLSGNYAAKICNDLVSEGFSDWYLPARNEMEAIKQNASSLSSVPSGQYWTSTEANDRTAHWITFLSGPPPTNIKTATAICRCVRRD